MRGGDRSSLLENVVAAHLVAYRNFPCTIAGMATTTRPLNKDQLRFIDEYYSDPKRDPAAAYSRVYSCKGERSAGVAGRRLLADPRVQTILAKRDIEVQNASGLTAAEVARDIRQIAMADPRELMEYRRGACRYCYGDRHEYQFTPREQRDRMRAYAKMRDGQLDPNFLKFDQQGGVGFNPNKSAHPDCPECFGHGEGYSYFKDLRDVSLGAARLFAGVKQTKDGLVIVTRNQDKMLELAAKTIGMLRDPGENGDDNIPPAASVSYVGEDCS